MRVRAIDAFRGLAVVLMVFFSMTIRLSGTLPDALKHNVPNSLHVGDFVLTMFLFASGMSLAHFHRKREKNSSSGYFLDVLERLGLFAMVWAFISPFSSGLVFGMDELALNLVLSVAALAVIRMPDAWVATICLVPPAAYFILAKAGALPDFDGLYLGGFAAAPFYLPVMLAGVLAARDQDSIWKIGMAGLVIGLALAPAIAPDKSVASPSFIFISIAVSAAAFISVEKLGLGWFEYPGKKPLEFWAMMFIFLIAPLVFNAAATGSDLPLDMPWQIAVVASVACVPALICVSLALGTVSGLIRRRLPGRK